MTFRTPFSSNVSQVQFSAFPGQLELNKKIKEDSFYCRSELRLGRDQIQCHIPRILGVARKV